MTGQEVAIGEGGSGRGRKLEGMEQEVRGEREGPWTLVVTVTR